MKFDDIVAEQIMNFIKPEGFEAAFIGFENVIYFVSWPTSQKANVEYCARSPIVDLIQIVFDQNQDRSFFILRNFIYSSYKLGPMDKGMIKLAAKKVVCSLGPGESRASTETQSLASRRLECSLNFQFLNLSNFESISSTHQKERAGDKFSDSEWLQIYEEFRIVGMSSEKACHLNSSSKSLDFSKISPLGVLKILSQKIVRSTTLHSSDRLVSAFLIDTSGRLLAWGVNTSSLNKTLHAEVNLVQFYVHKYKTKIPKGSKMYVTHKPCKMCSGMIFECCESYQDFKLFYIEEVEGCCSRSTELDKWSISERI